MKILFILNAIKDEKAGSSGTILNLAEALRASGQEVDSIFRDDFLFFRKDSRLTRIIAFLTFPILILFMVFIKRFDKKYDVITISSGDGCLYAMVRNLFGLNPKAKFVMRSHGLEHIYLRNLKEEARFTKGSISLTQRLYLPLLRMREVELSIRYCDLVTCYSSVEKAYIEKIFKKDIKVDCIPNGVSESFFIHSEERRDGLLFVGDWNYMKGSRYLVQIFLSVIKEIPDTRLSIVVHKKKIEEVEKGFPDGTLEKIRVYKDLFRQELIKLYASHSVFLFPSISEGFGKVILEAMAAEMAVVVTDDFGWNDIIRNWENGVLVRKRDVDGFAGAAIELLKNEEMRREIGIRASQAAKDFTWENIAKRTLLSYENLIKDDGIR